MFVDPLAEETMDPYGYCYNNPINLIDPDGKLPIIPVVWAAIEIGGAIYDGYQAYKHYQINAQQQVKNGQLLVALP